MKLSRRHLFALLAGAVLDPEKLLWEPGKKLISIPKPYQPTNLFVRSDGSDWNSGLNHEAPLKTLSRAITLASHDGTTIWVMGLGEVIECIRGSLYIANGMAMSKSYAQSLYR